MNLAPRRRPAGARAPRAAAVAAIVVLASPLIAPNPASARASLDLAWSLPQLFGVALRYVRVDRGCRVVDKDEQSAYIAFECEADAGRKRSGALELIPTTIQGRPGVRAQVSLVDETHGAELRFLDLLERKIREEKGPPASPTGKPAPPPAATPDGGA